MSARLVPSTFDAWRLATPPEMQSDRAPTTPYGTCALCGTRRGHRSEPGSPPPGVVRHRCRDCGASVWRNA
jgi:hypothetical protein